jgi:hypothetical protein
VRCRRHGGEAILSELDEVAYTGLHVGGPLVFPAWLTDTGSPLARAAVAAAEGVLGQPAETGVWEFSTNGTYWAGEAGIPTVGFGPGDERDAHTPNDRVACGLCPALALEADGSGARFRRRQERALPWSCDPPLLQRARLQREAARRPSTPWRWRRGR